MGFSARATHRLVALLATVASASAASGASGASGQSSSAPMPLPGRVQVSMPACDTAPVDPASLLWALRVELAVDGVSSVEFAPPGSHPGDEAPLATIALKAPCDPAALELTIEIDDVATSKTLERRVSVADVPPTARARAVAIGAAELLRASWAELALAQHPAAAVPAQTDFLRRAVALHLTGPQAESMMQPDALITVVLDGRLFPTTRAVSSDRARSCRFG